MKSKLIGCLVCITGLSFAAGGDDIPKAEKPLKKDNPPDYSEFSKIVHKMALKEVPKYYEDNSGWGQTVPMPPNLRFPNLRTKIKVGERLELPHGVWRKVKVWMDEPAKDLQIRVRDFKSVDAKTFRLNLEAEAAVKSAVEGQHWQMGLALLGFTGKADTTIGVALECDVGVALITSKFPPELKVEPKVTKLKMDLKDFTLREVSTPRLGKVLEGDRAKEFGDQYKGFLQDAMRVLEPAVKHFTNEAIAKSIKEGKGTLSADAMMKIMTSAPKEKKDKK